LHRMHHEIEVTTRKLELEKRRLAKLDEDSRRAKQEYEDKVMPKKNKGKKDTAVDAERAAARTKKETHESVAHSLRSLEYRLEKAIVKLNHVSHDNQEHKNKINEIRRERIQLNQVFRKAIDDIRKTTNSIERVKTEADESKNTIEDTKVRIAAMKKRRDRERKEFGHEVERLKMQTKNQDREKKEGEVKMYKEAVSARNKREYMIADEESEFSEASMMKRILKLAFLNTIQRRHIKQHQKNIEIFEQAFATIKSTTGISDIEEIVRIFVKLEERNFSLLTYVNDLNREIEEMEKGNKELNHSLAEQRRSEEDAELRRKDELSALDIQIQRTQQAMGENDDLLRDQHKILDEVTPVVRDIANKIDIAKNGHCALPREGQDDILTLLSWIEASLGKWREFIPDREGDKHFKPFPCTVAASVKHLQAKRFGQPHVPLLRAHELPNAKFEGLTGETRPGNKPTDGAESTDSEEDYEAKPWSLKELREKTKDTIQKRQKKKKQQDTSAAEASLAKADGDAKADEEQELGYEELVEKGDGDSESTGSSDTFRDQTDAMWPTDDEVNEIFLKRYKMTKEELQAMADRMGIQLNNLCYLKQEFDAYDQDRSGCIDRAELKGLLEKLGEELTEEELDAAFKELDADGSGEIEFFEFVEWFTSD